MVTECADNIVVRSTEGVGTRRISRKTWAKSLRATFGAQPEIMHVGFPIRGSDTGDYVVRNLVGIDPKNKLMAVGEVLEPGKALVFCKRDAQTAREDLARVLAELKREVPAARGALYFSCVGRGEHMFGRRGAEQEMIRDAIGAIPLVGFFCNGEISHDRLYGYTGVLTLFH